MFETLNYAEAVLWATISLILGACAVFRPSSRRTGLVAASLAFLIFGLSDVVETRTGAWWRPWWLLLWKAACVVTLFTLYGAHRTRRRAISAGAIGTHEHHN